MSEYKYPVKYFCGPGLLRYRKSLIEKGMQLFNKHIAVKKPITGETGLDGVLLDFNCGLRLQIPEGNWHVRIVDGASGLSFLDDDISAVTLVSMEKFFIEWEIALWFDGEPVFYHQFDPRGQSVHFIFARPTLGDNIAFFPYVEEFLRTFDCRLTCTVPKFLRGIFSRYHPAAELRNELPEDSYACFYMSAWSNLPMATTSDMRAGPLASFGRSILRLNQPSKVIYKPTVPRAIKEPYVCIGVQASHTPKCWLNTDGWFEVIEYLRALGYRVLCVDKERKHSDYEMTVKMPRGVEDMSGDYSLLDRVNQLAYADFFVGVSSGLSWLAWAVDIPVVLISGITEYWYEFDSAYRVSNELGCHGCFNSLALDPTTMLECQLYKGTERAFECSKNISARQVIAAIERLRVDKNL